LRGYRRNEHCKAQLVHRATLARLGLLPQREDTSLRAAAQLCYPCLSMSRLESSIVFGVFKGMGDLVCAAPVIRAELQRGRAVHLLLFPNATLHEFCRLIDLPQESLHLHAVPGSASFSEWKRFVVEMHPLAPEMVWISPHAPAADSSWKIPLVLRVLQTLFWKKARLIGADTERLSLLLHQRLPVDRSLPLQQREWSAYRLLRGASVPEHAPRISFLAAITALRHRPPLYDLVIHPGANAKNRLWPLHKYAALVGMLPRAWRIAVLGLPADLEVIRKTMPSDCPVDYITGTIRKSIETLATASMLFIMDSGNMHFAQVLGVPATAVFGYTDPADIIDLRGCVEAIYDAHFPCQPCRKAVCSQPEIYCLESIDPGQVAEKLRARWDRVHAVQLIKLSAI
jgi:heptosyltransferase-2